MKFSPLRKDRLLPAESHQMVCLVLLDAFDMIIQDSKILSKGFSDASFLSYEGVAKCDG